MHSHVEAPLQESGNICFIQIFLLNAKVKVWKCSCARGLQTHRTQKTAQTLKCNLVTPPQLSVQFTSQPAQHWPESIRCGLCLNHPWSLMIADQSPARVYKKHQWKVSLLHVDFWEITATVKPSVGAPIPSTTTDTSCIPTYRASDL